MVPCSTSTNHTRWMGTGQGASVWRCRGAGVISRVWLALKVILKLIKRLFVVSMGQLPPGLLNLPLGRKGNAAL